MKTKTLNSKVLIFLIGLFIIGCTPNYDKIFKENISKFETKKKEFEKLKVFISNSDFKSNEKILIKQLSTEAQKIANELGIMSIEITNYNNCDENSITFNIEKGWNINKLNVVQFIFDSCKKETKKEKHRYDGNHMDVWGLGDNWIMFSDTDFI